MLLKQRYDRSDIRQFNAVSVLNQLRLKGSMSRANIAVELGLTRATVSNIVADLLKVSLLKETEFDEGGAGRPGLLLALNPDCGCMIAVDIDIDRISVVMANFGQVILWQNASALELHASPEVCLGQAIELVVSALIYSERKSLKCYGICVAWAGLVDRENGQLAYGPTSGWQQVPLKKDWEKRFGVPVYVENEAHAGAIGTFHFGVRAGVRDFIYLSLGVGLGAGIFADGSLLRGKQGFAGQVGHTFFANNGIQCSCGKQGCWVTEIGASALKRKLLANGVELPSSTNKSIDWIDLVLEKARAGDRQVLSVLETTAAQLGSGVARLVQTFNPALLIIGGRLGELMALVKPSISQAMREETIINMTDPVELVVHESLDDRMKGCLATVFDAIMKNPATVKSIS